MPLKSLNVRGGSRKRNGVTPVGWGYHFHMDDGAYAMEKRHQEEQLAVRQGSGEGRFGQESVSIKRLTQR